MSTGPIIAFGQQPCGFFPRRFLYAKIVTARRLREEMGGRIVFFYHDSDHDPRETQTGLRHRRTGELHWLNFAFENKVQRKYSPLHLKRVSGEWKLQTARQLPAFVSAPAVEAFRSNAASTVGEFCLGQMRSMGLLEGIEIVRSSDPEVREAACDIGDFYVDVPFEGEVVRARLRNGSLALHEGGASFLTLPPTSWTKRQVSPTRDTRLRWMQSVLRCTHYVSGAGEQAYINKADAPEIVYVNRDFIERPDEAYADQAD
ncbi:MAG: hypothetical protein KBA71_10015 [Opitutaceae bacterium]|nr:hypothetical protein [Opitutaceae bacterium]